MPRLKTINGAFAEFCVESLRRFRAAQKKDPEWQPTESQARVLKLMAESQVILQRRKEVDEELEDGKSGMTLTELEAVTAGEPPPGAGDAPKQ